MKKTYASRIETFIAGTPVLMKFQVVLNAKQTKFFNKVNRRRNSKLLNAMITIAEIVYKQDKKLNKCKKSK